MGNQLAQRKPETGIDVIRNFMYSPDIKNQFETMMGKGASYYINQVLLVVANSAKLQLCTPQSIFISAMRAATLKLSVDPAQGQAWIIPYAGVATFQLGYKGVYELAQRTNLYRFINVFSVYEGETIKENRMTGIQSLDGHKTSDEVWAYMLYFKLTNGFEKTFLMTVDEIENHAATYAPKAFNDPDSAWNRNHGREREKMYKKTVLKNGLSQWGRFNPGDMEAIAEIEDEKGWIGPNPLPEPVPPADHATPEQIAAHWPADASMQFETAATIKNRDGELYISFGVEELEAFYQALVHAIKANGLPPETKADLEMKRDAALLIQNAIIAANIAE